MKIPAHAKYQIIYDTMQKNDNLLNVAAMCEIAGVSRSGYYHYLSTEDQRMEREEQDRQDFLLILKAYQYRGYHKGARSIYMRLLHMEPPIVMNIKKIRRLMKKYNLQCPIRKANPYRRMAKAMATAYTAPNIVNREFEEHGPRKILLTGYHVYYKWKSTPVLYVDNYRCLYQGTAVMGSQRIPRNWFCIRNSKAVNRKTWN